MRLNKIRENLAANPERSPLMRSYGYASADDRPAFADMDVGVRATQEQLAEFARFPLIPFPSCNLQAESFFISWLMNTIYRHMQSDKLPATLEVYH